jgi:anti-repressor protein
MNELVHIDNQQVVTDSRSVAEHFGKRHDHVMRDIEAYKKDVPNFGEMFHETTMPDSYGRQQKAYLMNRDGFSLLVMGFTGKVALEWKLKYIDAFNAMEKAIKTPQLTPSEQMARGLIAAQKLLADRDATIAKQKEQIDVLTPKGIFADAVTASKTSILVGGLAKLIKQQGIDIGQKRLFAWMRENGFLIKNGTEKNMPTQRAMEMKLFEVKEGSFVDGNGVNRITRTTKVTGKGQVYFVNKFLNNIKPMLD